MSVPPAGGCPRIVLDDHAFHDIGERAREFRFGVGRQRARQIRHGRALRGQRLVFGIAHVEVDGLAAEEQRRRAFAAAVEREVVGGVVPADLQHPGFFLGGCAEDAHVVVAAVPADLALVDRLQEVIGDTDFVEHLQSAGRKRRGRDAACRVVLLRVQIAETQARARHDADGKIRPADRRLAHERAFEGFALLRGERFLQRLDRGDNRLNLAAARGRTGAE